MTPNEIRGRSLNLSHPLEIESAKFEILQEMCAQIAELNESIRKMQMDGINANVRIDVSN
jgi:hypothetical protein